MATAVGSRDVDRVGTSLSARVWRRGGAAVGAAAVAGLTWSLVEAQSFVLREVSAAVLAPGARPIRALHISDLHLTPTQRRKADWVRDLGTVKPDLVVNTGDNLAHPASLPVLMQALAPLLTVPGVFALGSNDYFAPQLRNPLRYLLPDARRPGAHAVPPDLPGRQLQHAFIDAGWKDLANRRAAVTVDRQRLSFVGTADAHMNLDRIPAPVAADPGAVAHIGVTHAPYRRVLQGFLGDGCQMTFAGHTHGGQLCLPVLGALTTNCDLDNARAKGLHGWPGADPSADDESMWLHVSAGLGTNPFTPVRFFCRPEATLVTLTARQ